MLCNVMYLQGNVKDEFRKSDSLSRLSDVFMKIFAKKNSFLG